MLDSGIVSQTGAVAISAAVLSLNLLLVVVVVVDQSGDATRHNIEEEVVRQTMAGFGGGLEVEVDAGGIELVNPLHGDPSRRPSSKVTRPEAAMASIQEREEKVSEGTSGNQWRQNRMTPPSQNPPNTGTRIGMGGVPHRRGACVLPELSNWRDIMGEASRDRGDRRLTTEHAGILCRGPARGRHGRRTLIVMI